MIDIRGLDKADVLIALHSAAHAVGLGVLHDIRRPLTREEANQLIAENKSRDCYFDYVLGRPLKVWLNRDEIDPWGIDRDAGEGTAQRAIEALREQYKKEGRL